MVTRWAPCRPICRPASPATSEPASGASRPSLRDEVEHRLGLFRKICEAVNYAHQRGVIHRDLKPSNVLVRMLDDRPVPTIIDFGIAKATQQRLTERTMFTAMGMLIGTPEYMSPEQAEMTGLDVDTRTDVYSLGVMLYELLVGALPFAPEDLDPGPEKGQRHTVDVQPRDFVTWKLDLKQTGVGGDNSWGAVAHRRSSRVVSAKPYSRRMVWRKR